MSFNLATILRESALAHPDKPALRFLGKTTSYADLDRLSTQFANGLRDAGLAVGDAVGVCLPNVPEFPIAYFGVLKAGLTMVPMNPLLKGPEIAYLLEDSGARLLINFELFNEAAQVALAEHSDVRGYVVAFPGSDTAPPAGFERFEALLGSPDADAVRGDVEPRGAEDTAVLLYTSGTTGKPKGAELTHFQLFMNCTTAGELFETRDDDVTLAVLPFFHVFGLSSVLNLTIRYGGTLSVVPRFEVDAVLDAMESDRVTVVLGVPTMLQALLEADTTARDLSAMRVAVSGGASMPGEVMRAFEEKFPGVVILEGYGLSESASTSTFNRSAEERRVLSIGKPIWGVEMRIVDGDDRSLPAGPDNLGEIVIRGHNIMKGYHNRPEETAEAFRNGWFHTGDVGYVDDDGFFFVVDRTKDLVIRGGYNVYPREIEEVLYGNPAVAEAAVIGKPDDRLGEEVVAVVVLKPGRQATAAEIIAYCKERLAAYKYPREVRFVDELPKGPTGKILKKELRSA